MIELCNILQVTVNDLLCGEVVTVENYDKKLENNLIEMVKQKEETDKRLLKIEIVLGVIAILPLIASIIIANVIPMEEWQSGLLVGLSLIPLLIAAPFAIRIEQKAGYYECPKCGHKHVPRYVNVFLAMHVNRTRYMRCPNCGKKSWQKKIISKE
jgi:DNA-directed RNA polymerase subunit RPC12/RpoP